MLNDLITNATWVMMDNLLRVAPVCIPPRNALPGGMSHVTKAG
jgi:hypothetical protein